MGLSYQKIAPGLLQIREGGGLPALFGLPFFAAGIFLSLAALRILPASNADEMPAFAWPVIGLMAVAFTAVGGMLVFGRARTIVDVTGRRIVKRWSLLVPLRERTYPLADYSAVRLGFEPGDSDTSERFPVSLKARAGPDLPLCSFTNYAESRECAAAVAQHLLLDLEDASTDHPIRMSPGHADGPFQRSTWRERMPLETATRPPDARSQVSREAGAVKIVIPRWPLHPIVQLAMLVPILIPLVFVLPLSEFFRRTQTPDGFAWPFLAFILGGFVVLPAMTFLSALLRSRRAATIVSVSRQGIRIEERGAWRTRLVSSSAAADILHLDFSTRESTIASARQAAQQQIPQSTRSAQAPVGPRTEWLLGIVARLARGRGLTVKTKQGFTTFGEGLDDDEIRYLYAVVREGLDGESRRLDVQ
jgi:hypothetical protein